MKQDSDFFRANVGAMITNGHGGLLAFKRARAEDHAWQLPQGGLRPGERPVSGVLREVREETGVVAKKLKLLAESADWLAYELPKPYRDAKTGRGQVQKWFLFLFQGTDDDIQPDGREFSAWRWIDQRQLIRLAVRFRRSVYERVLTEFREHLPSRSP